MFIQPSTRLQSLIAAVLVVTVCGSLVHAQEEKKADAPAAVAAPAAPAVKLPPFSSEPPVTSTKPTAAAEAAIATNEPTLPKSGVYDLTPEKIARFQKYLPKAFKKLTNREPFHIVELSDGVMESSNKAGEDEGMNGLAARFAKELAMQFYYTGGVRLTNVVAQEPERKKGKKAPLPIEERFGPQITLRLIGREDGIMLHAPQALPAAEAELRPSLVIVRFGLNDAMGGATLAQYARALQSVIERAHSKGAEVVLVGPALTAVEPEEEGLGITRPYADTMREIAADSGILFMDAGDLSTLVLVSESVREPEKVFEQVVSQYRRFFDPEGTGGLVRTRPEFHSLRGTRLFSELTVEPAAAPWQISEPSITVQSAEKMSLRYKLKNTTSAELKLAMLPLISSGWRPMEASPEIALKPGEETPVEVTYASGRNVAGVFSAHEPLLRMPVLLSGGGFSRIEDLRAEVRPFAFLWKLDTLFNQQKTFSMENFVINTSGAAIKVTWTATFLGQKKTGEVSLAAGEKKPVELIFDLPASTDAWRQTGPLGIEISSGGVTQRFERTVELSRNLGLKQTVALSSLADPSKLPPADAPVSVRLKFDADPTSLFLIYEIEGVNIEDRGRGLGAFGCEVGLDARSYGKRLEAGAIGSLRVFGQAADGSYGFEAPEPWAFGDEYAAVYDPHYFRAHLTSTATGARRLTITIPRSYLYLHEWAIGNGNSQLGLRTTLGFWKGPRDDAPNGGYPRDLAFALLANGRHPDDALGLAVLELSEKPTARWTVNPF